MSDNEKTPDPDLSAEPAIPTWNDQNDDGILEGDTEVDIEHPFDAIDGDDSGDALAPEK